jgi:uncharacterized protein
MRIFIAGGSGLIGSRLIPRLLERGDKVVLLSRRALSLRGKFGADCEIVEGDPMTAGAWMRAVDDCAGVVNLTGENIFARRWNSEFKERLRRSRIDSTQQIVDALARRPTSADGRPRVLVNASAIGYYGARGAEPLAEDAPPGQDFMSRLCVDWEAAAHRAKDFGVRVVVLRVGVVFDSAGGALQEMVKPFRLLGFSGPIGSGRHYVSWIHHQDLTGIILLALDNAMAEGPINGTAPNPATNRDLVRAQGQILDRAAFLATPALAIRLMLGEVAQLVTVGQCVLPRKALTLGYAFHFPTLPEALRDTLIV